MRAATILFFVTLMLAASPFLAPNLAWATDLMAAPNAVNTDSGDNTAGDTDAIQTPSESCRAACNRDYEICGDEGSASDQSMNGRPSAGFSKNHCNASLTDCLKRCKGL